MLRAEEGLRRDNTLSAVTFWSLLLIGTAGCDYDKQGLRPWPRSLGLGTQTKIAHRSFFNFYINLFIYLFLAALGLRCCTHAFSSCCEWGLLFVAVRGLLVVVASLVAGPGLQPRGLPWLWHAGSVVVAHGL